MKENVFEAKRAIFMAAGLGSRMNPVTLNTPKPLVKVNGIRIMDTLIDALLSKRIDDITIVRGYLGNKFNELLEKYPMIKFIDNDKYDTTNNIYSIYLARHLLEDAYILEADLLLSNKDIITKYHNSSDFLAFKIDYTDDWCFDTKDNIITGLHKGGTNTYQEIGISYWTKEDGSKLSKHIEEAYKKDSSIFWESVPINLYPNEYNISIKQCNKEDIVEIDTFEELCKVDESYSTTI